jgi:hypothetical protein
MVQCDKQKRAVSDWEGFGKTCPLGKIFRSQNWARRIRKSKHLKKVLLVR